MFSLSVQLVAILSDGISWVCYYNRWKRYLFRINFKIVVWYLEEHMVAKASEGDSVARIQLQ
jgi:hypothetical protein